ncbi:myotubularin-related protein 2-like isoform X2 [Gordionus sp. m RMFG-2023]|uniref:myotubularin-related protein 2-like isoform X2 n=1 Tax=Gordionus sp. m RMFG-2023 TaxID=3053472 RepID=UPI0031FBB838
MENKYHNGQIHFFQGEKIICENHPVNYLCPFNGSITGLLGVTNFRLTFTATQKGDVILDLPLGVVYRLEKIGNLSSRGENSYGIEVYCKDLRTLKFAYKPENHSRRHFFEQLYKLAFPLNHHQPIWAFSFRDNFDVDGWKVYRARGEYERQGLPDESWRLTDINRDYTFCDTYPSLLCVPRAADDDMLTNVARFRSKNRLPVLSWKCHSNSQDPRTPPREACLVRGAQPLSGLLGGSSPKIDASYLRHVIEANAHFSRYLTVYDARPRINAVANKAKGGGYESEEHYKDTELIFLDIHNIHVVRESLKKLTQECFPYVDEEHWLTKLEATQWLEHIRTILFGALRIVDKIDNQQSSVFVHCSDGWDRTAQLTSLSMLMLDPYYRTIEGFEVLIEKEWISFGHKFAQRLSHGYDNYNNPPHSHNNTNQSQSTTATHQLSQNNLTNNNEYSKKYSPQSFSPLDNSSSKNNSGFSPRSLDISSPKAANGKKITMSNNSLNSIKSTDHKTGKNKNKPSEVSPIFLQFIDCVYQLTRQFPAAFEFDETLLIYILDNLYACLYGTFLGNTEKERVNELKVTQNTYSLWSAINSSLEDFTNPFYNPYLPNLILYPIVTIRHLEFWDSYYLRWNPYTKCQEPVQARYKQLNVMKRELEREVIELTEKLKHLEHLKLTSPKVDEVNQSNHSDNHDHNTHEENQDFENIPHHHDRNDLC